MAAVQWMLQRLRPEPAPGLRPRLSPSAPERAARRQSAVGFPQGFRRLGCRLGCRQGLAVLPRPSPVAAAPGRLMVPPAQRMQLQGGIGRRHRRLRLSRSGRRPERAGGRAGSRRLSAPGADFRAPGGRFAVRRPPAPVEPTEALARPRGLQDRPLAKAAAPPGRPPRQARIDAPPRVRAPLRSGALQLQQEKAAPPARAPAPDPQLRQSARPEPQPRLPRQAARHPQGPLQPSRAPRALVRWADLAPHRPPRPDRETRRPHGERARPAAAKPLQPAAPAAAPLAAPSAQAPHRREGPPPSARPGPARHCVRSRPPGRRPSPNPRPDLRSNRVPSLSFQLPQR